MDCRTPVDHTIKRLFTWQTPVPFLENHAMLRGHACLVSAYQDHGEHTRVCGNVIAQGTRVLAAGFHNIEPDQAVELANIHSVVIPHFLEHVEFLAKDHDRRQLAQDLRAFITSVEPVYQYMTPIFHKIMKQKGTDQL